jgi:hypothetical protein
MGSNKIVMTSSAIESEKLSENNFDYLKVCVLVRGVAWLSQSTCPLQDKS